MRAFLLVGAVGATGTRWDWRRGEHARIPDEDLRGDVEVDTIGGGQNLTVQREVIERIGTPEPAFFFGFVFCARDLNENIFQRRARPAQLPQCPTITGRQFIDRSLATSRSRSPETRCRRAR